MRLWRESSQPAHRLLPWSWVAISLALSSGCGGGEAGIAPVPAPSDAPAPPPTSVPVTLEERMLAGHCLAREEGERVVGVGSEGDLWLAAPHDHQAFRVVRRDGSQQLIALGLEPSVMRPWSDSEAAFAVGPRLFVREADGRIREVAWPRELGSIVDLCGDPRRDGAFVIAEGTGDVQAGLYRRAGGEWWRWSRPEGTFGAELALASVSGACTADDDRAWLRSDMGVFALREDRLEAHAERADALAIDRRLGVAMLTDGQLKFWAEDRWKPTRFDAGAVTAVSSAADHLWVQAGDRVHHFAEASVSMAKMDLPGAVDALHADAAGGVWIETGAQLCYRSFEGALHVRGVRPFQRLAEPELTVTVDASEMRVELDGAVVHDGEPVAVVELGSTGWHRIDLEAEGMTRRFFVLHDDEDAPTWEEHIRPIAEAHCGGSACHGSEQSRRAVLLDYESWVDFAPSIRHRVGVVGDMPPTVARSGWTAREVTTIVRWIAAGMEEGDASE